MLDIIPSRLQDYIYHYLIYINERLSIEFVIADLVKFYKSTCRNLF